MYNNNGLNRSPVLTVVLTIVPAHVVADKGGGGGGGGGGGRWCPDHPLPPRSDDEKIKYQYY